MLAFHKAKMESMMEGVRTLHSTEEVPVRYAVETLRSDIRSMRDISDLHQWYQQHFINNLSQDLQIVMVRNRYVYLYNLLDFDV